MYTDGACRGNPGPGGWGVFLRYDQHEKKLFGGDPLTTNNRMELQAVIEGLAALKRPCEIDLYTDSKYVRDGMTQWLENWKRRGWKTAAKKPVKNDELWKRLDDLTQCHNIHWHWVKGHAGNHGNELADQLANRGIDEMMGKDS